MAPPRSYRTTSNSTWDPKIPRNSIVAMKFGSPDCSSELPACVRPDAPRTDASRPATIDKQQFRSKKFPCTILKNDMQKSGRTHLRAARGFLLLQNCYLSIVAALQKICGRACCPATIDKQQFRSNEFPRTILENDVQKSGRTHLRAARGFLSLQNGYLSIVAALQKMCGRVAGRQRVRTDASRQLGRAIGAPEFHCYNRVSWNFRVSC